MNELNGTEIVNLIGLSETDDRVLDLIDLLGVDVSKIARSEYNDDYWISLDEEIGLELSFTDTTTTPAQKANSIGGLFLNRIDFGDNCDFLPFGIEIDDSLESIEKKIGKKANYIMVIDEEEEVDEDDIPTYTLYWIYEDLGWFRIHFFEPSFTEVFAIDVQPYENPEDPERYKNIFKPFKRQDRDD